MVSSCHLRSCNPPKIILDIKTEVENKIPSLVLPNVVHAREEEEGEGREGAVALLMTGRAGFL